MVSLGLQDSGYCPSPFDVQDLCYGYYLKSGVLVFRDFISSAELLFHHETVVSYRLWSKDLQGILGDPLPEAEENKPISWCRANEMCYINPGHLTTLENDPSPVLDEMIAYYMSPFCGTEYGCRGGFGSTPLSNRQSFKKLGKTIAPELLLDLLYSVNPASRITALDHFLQNQDMYRSIEDLVLDRMACLRVDCPEIRHFLEGGCVLVEEPFEEAIRHHLYCR